MFAQINKFSYIRGVVHKQAFYIIFSIHKNFKYVLFISSVFDYKNISFIFFFFFFLLQITEALSYLHYSKHVIHKNVCPSSILVTKKGTWKLAGLEFIGKMKILLKTNFFLTIKSINLEKANETDAVEPIPTQSWTTKISKMIQPNLDYTGLLNNQTKKKKKPFNLLFIFFPAPEIQLFSNCNILSDMFSLGMVICSIFNQGRPLISANNSTSTYARQLEVVRFYGLL